MDNERADAGRDGRTRLARSNSQTRTGTGKHSLSFPCPADHEQDWQPYSVDPYPASADHTNIPKLELYMHTHMLGHDTTPSQPSERKGRRCGTL